MLIFLEVIKLEVIKLESFCKKENLKKVWIGMWRKKCECTNKEILNNKIKGIQCKYKPRARSRGHSVVVSGSVTTCEVVIHD